MASLYDVLGLTKDANPEDIKKAYKRMAMKHHPDKFLDENEKHINEAKFKEINEAYSVLSDPAKKSQYDQFGTYGDMPQGPGMGMNMNDILRDIFGGAGPMPQMHQMGGGGNGAFSFMFMDGMPGMPGMPHQQRPKRVDTIDVRIDINDIYYGETKNVEFEMLEQCHVCKGSGAQDPSHILKCITCNGNGMVHQQMGPFFTQTHTCPSCAGQGTTVQHNKQCQKCKGGKSVYNKKKFELKLPKGIPDNYEVVMEGKGAYSQDIKCNNDIRFKFIYNVIEPYKLDADKTTHYTVKLPLEELLAGFTKEVTIYREIVKLTSEHYFNPSKTLILHGMGVYDMQAEKPRDLHIHFDIVYQDNERFKKYSDVLKKVLKISQQKDETSQSFQEQEASVQAQEGPKVIQINNYL